MKKAFVIAATNSGAGKTTVTVGVMEALRRRGFTVQPFKAGPDYIDPTYHTALTGKTCYNLDTWMMGGGGCLKTFSSAMAGVDVGPDIGVVEGVMGLFDGRGTGSEGSTAELARKLKLPVVLVVDASGASTSVGAVVKGFNNFDKNIKLAGVIFNRIGSKRHFELVRAAVEKKAGVKVFGYLPKDASLAVPSKHLGLHTRGELTRGEWGRFIRKAAGAVEDGIDLDAILKSAASVKAKAKTKAKAKAKIKSKAKPVTIAVACDEAFNFCYAENLEILQSMGARIKFFSPLKDKTLPKDTGGIYIVGGYPELHGRALERNVKIRRAVRDFARSGGPVFAECGGLMYAGRSLRDPSGKRFEMSGIFPWTATMHDKRQSLGYREAAARPGCPFLKRGEKIRGHEYHYSALSPVAGKVSQAFVKGGGSANDGRGYVYKNTLATYVHLHFASNPDFARGFVEACKAACRG